MPPIVILGTGLAGYTLAKEIRKRDRDVPLRLVTADDGSAYSKPMLSNALGRGRTAEQLIMASAAHMAARLDARIDTGTRVTAIDRSARQVDTDKGTLDYSKLVLATGADPVRLAIDGDGADDILSINDLDDYRRFRERLAEDDGLVILGGGLIGCEFANDLVAGGHTVTVVDPAAEPLGRLLPEAGARHLQKALSEAGVQWQLGKTASTVDREKNGCHVTLSDGTVLHADLVLSAVGLRPRTGLATMAGLPTARGIQVDRRLQTADPDIFALGDCAEVDGLVLPFVTPLMHGARALAATLTGTPAPVVYPAMPVVVKTPACPVVVAPPAPGTEGEWRVEQTGAGTLARFEQAGGVLAGFALTGDAVSQKQRLTRELPPLLA